MTNTATSQTTVTKTEYAQDITSSKIFFKNYIPVMAGESTFFPSLAAVASQFQYYRFDWLNLQYAPVQGTQTNGSVAFAPVATWSDYVAADTWDKVLGLPNVVSGNVWKEHTMRIDVSSLSRQMKEGWRNVMPAAASDFEDPTQAQGFIIVAITNCDITDVNKTLGRFQLGYQATCLKPRVSPVIGSVTSWVGDDETDDSNMIVGSKRLASLTCLTPGSIWRLTTGATSPYLLLFKVTWASTAGSIAASFELPEYGSVTELAQATSATDGIYFARVNPMRRNGTIEIAADHAVSAVRCFVHDSLVGVRGDLFAPDEDRGF